jgi:hypothetical protein
LARPLLNQMPMGKVSGLRRLGRLFVIRTRWEAWAVTWAIALGAVERGKAYLLTYPAPLGWVFFLLCCGVVFVAGAKLLDSVRPEPAARKAPQVRWHPRRREFVSRSRPRGLHPAAAASRSSRRKD